MSDELIGEHDIRGTRESGLTVECAWNIGKALADWLPTAGSVVVVTIPTEKAIAEGVIEGLRLQGRRVIDGGNGTRESAQSYITSRHLAGAAVIGFDEQAKVMIIELYKDDRSVVSTETGLKVIQQMVDAGNFVPAASKGELIKLS